MGLKITGICLPFVYTRRSNDTVEIIDLRMTVVARLNTDTQHNAYVLRPGETEPPAGLVRALADANAMQDITVEELRPGRTGNVAGRARVLRPHLPERPRVILAFKSRDFVGARFLEGTALALAGNIDAVTRLLPGALGKDESALDESFSHGRLEYPHYTRPAEYRGWKVPEVLLSGDHARIERWRHCCQRL